MDYCLSYPSKSLNLNFLLLLQINLLFEFHDLPETCLSGASYDKNSLITFYPSLPDVFIKVKDVFFYSMNIIILLFCGCNDVSVFAPESALIIFLVFASLFIFFL